MNKLIIAAGLVIVGLVGAVLPVNKEGETIVEQLGAFSGPDISSYLKVAGWVETGGGRISIDPVDGTYTLTAADMDDVNIITHPASSTQAALTLTLPASTTFPIGTNPGAERDWIIENPFTAAATTTTIAAGTGIDLQEPDGQNVVIGINNYAYLKCIRGADSGAPRDIVCRVDETIPAD